jgi:hypothetical protein
MKITNQRKRFLAAIIFASFALPLYAEGDVTAVLNKFQPIYNWENDVALGSICIGNTRKIFPDIINENSFIKVNST